MSYRHRPLSLLLIMVRLAGIEPTTPWFVAKYSIQLSYSREEKDYSEFFFIWEAFMTFVGKFYGDCRFGR